MHVRIVAAYVILHIGEYVCTYHLVTMTLEEARHSLWIGSLSKKLVQNVGILKHYMIHPYGNYVIQAILESGDGYVHVGAVRAVVLRNLVEYASCKHSCNIVYLCCVMSDHDFWNKMSEQWNWKMGSAERVSRATVKLRDRINSLFRKKGVPWLKPVALNP